MKKRVIIIVTIAVVAVSFIVISRNKKSTLSPVPNINITSMETLKITSGAFEENGLIPSKYTCDGQNINPPLEIGGMPSEAKSLALIMYDPDIPEAAKKSLGVDIFVHWIKFNIPATTTAIKEGQEPGGTLGKGGSGKLIYVGPCPPDREHRYFFQIYALDSKLNLPEGSSKEELEQAMEGHILAWGELVGRYNRTK